MLDIIGADLRAVVPFVCPDYLQYWGKAQPNANASTSWHPAAYHMLDVVACFKELLPRYSPKWLDPKSIPDLMLLVAMHDSGKITRTFQAQCPAEWPTTILGKFTREPPGERHDVLGFGIISSMFRTQLEERLPGSDYYTDWLPLVKATAGHHGKPPEISDGMYKKANRGCCNICQKDVRELFKVYCDMFPAHSQPTFDPETHASYITRLHFWFAGMVTLADWLGSSSEWFPYTAPTMSLHDYWIIACERAKVAVREASLRPIKSSRRMRFSKLTGFAPPNPVQQLCDTMKLPKGGKLVMIEAVMGSGKTEAADILAHRMIVAGDGEGILLALPTMATANAMYDRSASVYRKLYARKAAPTLSLAHGKRKLNDDFCKSITRNLAATGIGNAPQCGEWLARGNRQAFFADVGVCTIDQVLMSCMPVKFSMLRLLGMSRKILIIDEAHAYDTYMLEILKNVLFFQARLGGSAIILSATLPIAMRNSLAAAFSDGLSVPHTTLTSLAYPLVTTISRRGVMEIQGLPDIKKRLAAKVEIVSSFEDVLTKIQAAVKAGACVAWVCNTVAGATLAADVLQQRKMNVTLFHSRLAMADRINIERNVLKMFGKDSCRPQRDGQVLVATQVIEQSLDLDFDLMVSDPAPIDLLLQRSGRLWRHLREKRPLPYARFLIASPQAVDEPAAGWLSDMAAASDAELSVSKSRHVYKDVALLWRSIRIAAQEGELGGVDAIRRVVEAAYCEENFHPYGKFIPSALTQSATLAANGQNKNAWSGIGACIDYEMGYAGSAWHSEEVVSTRLSIPTVTLRLGKVVDGQIVPWYQDSNRAPWMEWALSEVSTSKITLSSCAYAPHMEQMVKTTKAGWGKMDQELPLIPLEPEQDGWWSAEVWVEAKSTIIRYHREVGLEII